MPSLETESYSGGKNNACLHDSFVLTLHNFATLLSKIQDVREQHLSLLCVHSEAVQIRKMATVDPYPNDFRHTLLQIPRKYRKSLLHAPHLA